MTAVRYARSIGIKNIEARVIQLAQTLREALLDLDGVSVHDLGQRKCGIVTFQKTGIDPNTMAEKLRLKGINVSVSVMPYARLDLEPRNLSSLTRASVHYFNSEGEIERFVEEIQSM